MTELAKKVALTRAILSMRKLFADEYNFYPNSWFIPAQINEFAQHCEKTRLGNQSEAAQPWYIVKPDDGIVLLCSVYKLQTLQFLESRLGHF